MKSSVAKWGVGLCAAFALALALIACITPMQALADDEDAPVAVSLAGDGTSDNPYQVSSAAELIDAAKASSSVNPVSIVLNGDIDLSAVNASNGIYIRSFYGDIDGAGHKVFGAAEGASFIDLFGAGTIKNLEWNVDGVCYFVMNTAQSGDHNFEDITITGAVNYPSASNKNESPFVVYAQGDTTFTRVVNKANITSPTYNGIFVGYTTFAGVDYTFTDCVNEGTVNGAQVGMFFGNATAASNLWGAAPSSTLTITGCVNKGMITNLSPSGYIFGVGNPINGEGKTFCDNLLAQNPGLDPDRFVILEANGAFKVSSDQSGRIVLTRVGDASDVASIKIDLSVYAKTIGPNGENNGTTTHTVSETIPVVGGAVDTYCSALMFDMPFYDGPGEMSACGPEGSVKLVCPEGEKDLAYALCANGCAGDLVNGEIHSLSGVRGQYAKVAPELVDILLYDAQGNLVGKYTKSDIDKGASTIEHATIDEPVAVGTTLDKVAAPAGFAWVDPSVAVVDGKQTAYATKGNVLMPVELQGKSLVTAEGLRYEVNEDGTVTILGGENVKGTLTIPATIDGKTVVAIAPNAFANNDEITELYLPDSIKSIGKTAFAFCTALHAIHWDNAAAASPAAPDDEAKPFVDASAFMGCTAPDKAVWMNCNKYVDAMRDTLASLGNFNDGKVTWHVAHSSAELGVSVAPTPESTGLEVAFCGECGNEITSAEEIAATEARLGAKVPESRITYMVKLIVNGNEYFKVFNARAEYGEGVTVYPSNAMAVEAPSALLAGSDLNGWKVVSVSAGAACAAPGQLLAAGTQLPLDGSMVLEAVKDPSLAPVDPDGNNGTAPDNGNENNGTTPDNGNGDGDGTVSGQQSGNNGVDGTLAQTSDPASLIVAVLIFVVGMCGIVIGEVSRRRKSSKK